MQAEQLLGFGPYRLDLGTEQVWKGKHAVKLTPKALALLRVLVTRAGQVVTKEELLQVGWPQTVVSEDALTSCLQELRRALGDDARNPRYIETVHRRGFRFIAPVATAAAPVASCKFQVSRSDTQHSGLRTQHSVLVGREAELAQLHGWLEKALSGERQLGFVTGEPGIGKTTLVEAFLEHVGTHGDAPGVAGKIWLGRGQCIEHYGAGEAYLPVLEALGRLCRKPDGRHLIELLSQHAPTWMVQMPALLSATELEALQRKTQGATRERMLRELAEAVETLTAEKPLVLWLEDLQWSDVSTLDWLAFVARRREPARLLVIGTYRPTAVLAREHPLWVLKQELQVHGYCTELLLDFLSAEAVAEYLAVRFPPIPSPLAGEGQDGGALRQEHDRWPPHPGPLPRGEREAAPPTAALRRLAHVIHRRTDGNPLFMVNVVNDLVARGVLVQSDSRWELKGGIEETIGRVPESLQQLIGQQIERLRPETQRMLEVASVAGAEFSAAAVAAGVETEVDVVEEQCEKLVRQEHFLRASGTADWPDGTVAARYGFRHALYQEALYNRLTARQWQRLHQRIGEREEQAYGDRAREIATELALHFERGRDYKRAVQYLQQAGENALRRSAYQEAINHLTKGLELLTRLPDTPERAQQKLLLLKILGPALISMKGYGAPEVEQTYARAYELCQQGGRPRQLIGVLHGLQAFYLVRGEVRKACDLAEQTFRLAQRVSTPTALMSAHGALGMSLFHLGELIAAREHVEQAWVLYTPQKHNPSITRSWGDPGVSYLSYVASTLWYLGYPDQALEKARAALLLAHEVAHPFSLGFALVRAAALHFSRGEVQDSQENAEALIALATDQEFPDQLALGTALRGVGLVEQGEVQAGIAQLQHGLAEMQALGQEIGRPYYLACLAKAYGKQGQTAEGLRVMAEALAAVDRTGERYYEAELYRLKDELTLQKFQVSGSKFQVQESPKSEVRGPESEAEECFVKAIEIARQQQAKSLELRAVMSLSRLWQQQGKKKQARQMLAKIYGWFTEGFDTVDLQEAKALLKELS